MMTNQMESCPVCGQDLTEPIPKTALLFDGKVVSKSDRPSENVNCDIYHQYWEIVDGDRSEIEK